MKPLKQLKVLNSFDECVYVTIIKYLYSYYRNSKTKLKHFLCI